jgi:hypothetical protein
MRLLLISAVLTCIPVFLHGQDTIPINDDDFLYAVVTDGDTTLVAKIDGIYVVPKLEFSSKRDMRKYQKLIRNVKKVYPYAKLAKAKYDEVSAVLLTLNTDKERKKYMEQVENEIKDEFEEI